MAIDTSTGTDKSTGTSAGTDKKMDWALARKVAVRMAGDEPLYRSYLADRLHEDFAQATPIAEKLVQAETRLTSDAGAAHAVVIDRPAWIDANLRSFRRLLQPILGPTPNEDQPAGNQPDGTGGTGAASPGTESAASNAMAQLVSKIGAVELGAVLGWMSRRVLGQYDLLLATDDESEEGYSNAGSSTDSNTGSSTDSGTHFGDVVYYVGPNVLATEKRFAFPPGDFRLWLALHELTHRSQFTGVPWLRPHFLKLVTQLVETSEPDAEHIRSGLRSMMSRSGMSRSGTGRSGTGQSAREKLAEGGLATMFATDQQRELINQVGGMMSLVEGHGDAVMERAAVGHVPSAKRFHHVMHHRRQSSRGATRLLQRLMGIEAKLQQYQAGENFIEAIEAERGDRAVDRIWEDPDHLPSLDEIRDPSTWLARVPAV